MGRYPHRSANSFRAPPDSRSRPTALPASRVVLVSWSSHDEPENTCPFNRAAALHRVARLRRAYRCVHTCRGSRIQHRRVSCRRGDRQLQCGSAGASYFFQMKRTIKQIAKHPYCLNYMLRIFGSNERSIPLYSKTAPEFYKMNKTGMEWVLNIPTKINGFKCLKVF